MVDQQVAPPTYSLFGAKNTLSLSSLRVLYCSYKVQELMVYSLLKPMAQLHWLYSELEDQQVAPLK